MTRDDILRMAREAGIANAFMPPQFSEVFERFAALVAAAERDECAKVCDEFAGMFLEQRHRAGVEISKDCAAAIRARGTK